MQIKLSNKPKSPMGLIYLHLKTRNLYVEIMHLFSYGNDNDSHGIATDTSFWERILP